MQTYDVEIPCHNAAGTVVRAVQSALSCVGVLAVIVVDDGSTDDSLAVLGAIDDPRVCVEYQANGGPGLARNRGSALGTADRLIFLDADDVLLPNATDAFDAFPSAELVRSDSVRELPDGSQGLLRAESDPRPFPRGSPLAGSFAISRRLFARLRGYDERFRYGANTELLVRAGQEIGGMDRAAYVGRPTVRTHDTPDRNPNHYLRSRLASIELVRTKHRRLLRQDSETHRNYLAIAAVLSRAEGNQLASMVAASRAALVWPPEGRSWGRALRSAVELVVRRPLSSGSDSGLAADDIGLPSQQPYDEARGRPDDDGGGLAGEREA